MPRQGEHDTGTAEQFVDNLAKNPLQQERWYSQPWEQGTPEPDMQDAVISRFVTRFGAIVRDTTALASDP